MANNIDTYLQQKILDHFFKAGGSAAIAQPTALYVALFTADPTEAGVLTNEVAAAVGYARQAVSFGAPGANGTAQQIGNTGALTFGPATGAWGTVGFFAVVDAASGAANFYISGPLAASKVVGTGDSFTIAVGALTFNLD